LKTFTLSSPKKALTERSAKAPYSYRTLYDIVIDIKDISEEAAEAK